MTRLGFVSAFSGLLVFGQVSTALAEATNTAPPFNEVYDLIRAHLGGVSESELNRAAVQGLVSSLSPKVMLIANNAANQESAPKALVTRADVFEDDIGYLRIGRVDEGLAKSVQDGYDRLAATNKLKGLVLDLRFSNGSDYAAAAGVTDLFLKKEKPLLDWGDGVVRSKEKPEAIGVPVAVLMNRKTSAAAEALAASMRQTGTGLLLGGRTAGHAMISKDFPLKDGELLRIATAPIKLGDGSALSTQGVRPDILVEVNPQDERLFYEDPFREMGTNNLLASANTRSSNQAAGTNRNVRRNRFNEAELVRERKEGLNPESDIVPETAGVPEEISVQDPALARALDFLKGLAVVRQSRS
jgi:C-terminal processing protease CtpA/Prc